MEENTLKATILFFLKRYSREIIVLSLVVLVGAFFRLYKISSYMTFLGDEGRDAIVVWKLLTQRDIILVGPGTSIGNMYLGPLYYYFIAPFLWLFNYNPVGPSVMVALVGVLTIVGVYFITKEWFGLVGAAVASFLYAIAPTVIIYSRSSWNPNIMPFFSLLTVYSIWSVWKKGEYKWLMVLGVALAFVLQSHYLGLLLFPVVGLFWLLSYFKIKQSGDWLVEQGRFAQFSLLGLIIFLALMSPIVVFDARHGWLNAKAIWQFFTVRQETVSARPWTAIPEIPSIIQNVSVRLLGGRNKLAGDLVLAVLSVPSILLLLGRKNMEKNEASAYLMIFIWLAVAFLGLGVYKQEIYDHYYGFFFTAPFILIGGFVEGIWRGLSVVGKTIVMATLLFLIGINLYGSPLRNPPNYQLQRAKEVAHKIEEETAGERFNLAVIAERNYQDGYKYFLLKDKKEVVEIDSQRTDETITDQLFVVCEKPREKCDPTHSDKAEVANFGWSKIDKEWQIMGVTLFKLTHTKQ